jgi:hypothetical protein
MTGRNPAGTQDFPSRLLRRRLRPAAAKHRHRCLRGLPGPVRGTDDLSFHPVLELPAAQTPPARRHPPEPN